MDFKINLPSEECTCDARQFYDKYRKQVDAFIKNELEIAKTSKVVVGKKALISGYEEESVLSDDGEKSILPTVSVSGKTSVLSKKISKRKVRLPKIKGVKYKRTKKEGSESISLSTITTETHLPEIKATKKWSDDLSSSSSDIMQMIDIDQQKSWQEDMSEFKFEGRKKAKDELPSSSSEITQLLGKQGKSKIQQKKSKTKKKMAAKDELYSSSSEFMKIIEDTQKETKSSWQEEVGELLLKKEKPELKLSSSSLEFMQLLDRKKQKDAKSQQKKARQMQLTEKDAEVEEDEDDEFKEDEEKYELSSSSSEESQPIDDKQKKAKALQKVTGDIKVKKIKKPEIALTTRSSKEIIKPADEDKEKKAKPGQKTDDIKFKRKIEADDEVSVSSSEIAEILDEHMQKKTKLVQKSTGKIEVKKKKKSTVEHSSSSSEEIILLKDGAKQKETKTRQKEIDEKHSKKRMKSDYKYPFDDSETKGPSEEITLLQEERQELQLKKKAKSGDFVSLLKSKSKKEGLDDGFITDLLAQAREAGQEEDLLFYLSNANNEGRLQSILFNMSELIEKGEFEQFAANLVNKGKQMKRKSLLLKLIKMFKSDKKNDNDIAILIANAKKEDPDDELILMLSKAVKENNLNSLISHIYQAKKQGQLDEMVEILLKKGKREQTKRLLSIVNSIVHETGRDKSFVEELLSKAKDAGQLDELLTELMRAKSEGTLDELISTLVNATDEIPVNKLLSSIKTEEKTRDKKYSSSKYLEDAFDEDFIAKWFSKAKTKKEEQILFEKLSEVMKRGKSVEFIALAKEKSVEDIEDLMNMFEEVISDDTSDIDIGTTVSKSRKPPKLARPKRKPFKKVQKPRKRIASVVDQNLAETESPVLLFSGHSRKLSKLKRQILFKRQYSVTLPDVDYDLVGRHKLSSIDSTEPEKSDEEEHVYEGKIQKKISKQYRESFLKKIYGGRPIRPAGTPDSVSTSSSSGSRSVVRKHLPKKKTPVTVVEKEKKEPLHRKLKKNVVKYVKKKKPIFTEKEFSGDSDISSFEELLDRKISRMVDISGEERSERGYLVGFRYKDDEEAFDWKKKPKKKSSIYTDSYYSDEWISRARRRAIIYFSSRKIEDLFHFLGSHLVADQPGDPIDYLIMLLGECIHFRSGIGRPPILFEHYHVESLYCTMDIFNEGFISLDQYRNGMETLFIKEYVNNPRTNNNNMVLKETFIYEALKWQRIQLRNMLRGTSVIFNPKGKSHLGSVWSKVEVYHEG